MRTDRDRNRLLRIAATAATALLLPLVGCGGTPEPVPPPTDPVAAAPTDAMADHPWDLTPPDTPLTFVPGVDLGEGADVPAPVLRAARVWSRLTDRGQSAADRSRVLLARARPTCAIGRYGLPLRETERALFARMFVHHLDDMEGDVDALQLPVWHYRLLTVREFAPLSPAAIEGWMKALRVPDLPRILESGGSIVLLGADPEKQNWMLCTLWMPDAERVAALHVLRAERPENP